MTTEKTNPATVSISTAAYELTWGKRPSGTGDWAFQIGSNSRMDGVFWPPRSTFAKARKAAIKEAQRQGATSIIVLT